MPEEMINPFKERALALVGGDYNEFALLVSLECENFQKAIDNIFDSPDADTIVTDWELRYPEIKAKQLKEIEAKQLIQNGEKLEKICKDCLNYVKGFNEKSNFSLNQINEMRTTFSTINTYLKEGMPKTARELIELVEVNETVTQDLKDSLLEILKEA